MPLSAVVHMQQISFPDLRQWKSLMCNPLYSSFWIKKDSWEKDSISLKALVDLESKLCLHTQNIH